MPSHSTSPDAGNFVLVFSRSEKTRSTLLAILAEGGWTVLLAGTHLEAIALLRNRPIRVVIADQRWREIVDFSGFLPEPPTVIVTTPHADEALWAEVLNLGGFDVLVQPFDSREVTRIAQSAFRRWQAPSWHRVQMAG